MPRPYRSAGARAVTLCSLLALAGAAALGAIFPSPAIARARAAALAVKLSLKDGDSVGDVVTVVAKVTGADDIGVQKVEFLVDDQLKHTDTSTPYTYEWDTLADTEGRHTVTATAFDAQGRSQRAKVTVTVDNELGKGADYHAQQALAALKEKKPEVAARFARRALKIDPNNRQAARALAGIQRARGEYAAALAALEKVEIPESDTEVRAELVALYMENANAAASTEDYLRLASKAVDVYGKMAAAKAAAIPATEPSARGDALYDARNWAGAVVQYQKCALADKAPMECVNRMLLGYVMANRLREASSLIGTLNRERRSDSVTRALEGYTLLRAHKFAEARQLVQEGVENESLPALIVASWADLASKEPKRAREEADKAALIAPKLPEVLLLQAYTAADAIDGEKAAQKALEINPLLAEGYALRGYQTMLTRVTKRYAAADQLFDFALKRDPTSLYAQAGAALSLLAQNRTNEADPIVNQALAADPDGADLHVIRAVAYSLADKSVRINAELAIAKKLDAERWDDTYLPKVPELIARVYRFRLPALLTPQSIYPPKAIVE